MALLFTVVMHTRLLIVSKFTKFGKFPLADYFHYILIIKTSRDIEILGWCPAAPILPRGEKVPL